MTILVLPPQSRADRNGLPENSESVSEQLPPHLAFSCDWFCTAYSRRQRYFHDSGIVPRGRRRRPAICAQRRRNASDTALAVNGQQSHSVRRVSEYVVGCVRGHVSRMKWGQLHAVAYGLAAVPKVCERYRVAPGCL